MSHDRQIILPLHLTTRNAFTSHGISAITQGPTKFNALKSLFWTVNDCIFNVWVKSSGTAEHQKHNSWGVLPPASSFPPWGKLSPACSLVPVPWAPPQFLIPVLFFFFGLQWVFVAEHSLFIAVTAFSSCGGQGLLSSCHARASHCSGFSCCRVGALRYAGFCSCCSQALERRLSGCGTQV